MRPRGRLGLVLAAAAACAPAAPSAPPAPLSARDVEAEIASRIRADLPSSPFAARVSPPAAVEALVLRARLLDEQAGPVGGGRIAWNAPDAAGLPRARAERRSDSSGSAWLALDRAELAGEEPLLVSFDAPGRVRLDVALAAERWRGAGELNLGEVTLEPAGAVAGEVRDAAGRPVAGALAVVAGALRGSEEERWARSWPMVVFERPEVRPMAVTDADGRFSIGGVPAGRYQVVATSLSDGVLTRPARAAVRVTPGRTEDAGLLVLAEAERGERIEGIVSAPDGAPVSAAVVALGLGTDGEDRARVLTSDAGRFVLPAPSGLALRLSAHDPAGRFGAVVREAVRAGDAVALRFEAP